MTERIRIVLEVDGNQQATARLGEVRRASEVLGQQGKVTAGEVSLVKGALDGAGHSAADAGGRISILTGVLQGLGSAVTVGAVFQATKALSRVSQEFEAVDEKLLAVTGSTEAAGRAQAFAAAEAERLGLNTLTLSGAYAQLLAATRGTALEGEKGQQVYSALAEASAKLRLSTADTEGVMRALTQIVSKGVLSAEELRGQLGDRLPGAFQIAARAMGVSTAEMDRMLERGEILADDFLPRFADELRRSLGTDAATQVETTTASFARLGNEIRLVGRALGDLINAGAAPTAGFLADYLRAARQADAGVASGLIKGGAAGGLVAGLPGAVIGGLGNAGRNAFEIYQQLQLIDGERRFGITRPDLGALVDRATRPAANDPFGASGRLGPGFPDPGLQGLSLLSSGVDQLSGKELEAQARRTAAEQARTQRERDADLRQELATRQRLVQAVLAEQERAEEAVQARREKNAVLQAELDLGRRLTLAEQEQVRLGVEQGPQQRESLGTLLSQGAALEEQLRLLRAQGAEAARQRESARERVDGLLQPTGRRDRREDLGRAQSVSAIEALAAQDRLANETEYTRTLVDIEADRLANRRESLLAQEEIEERARQARERADRDYGRRAVAIEQETADAKRAVMLQQLDALSGVLGQAANVASTFGERGFQVYKALKIAEATIAIPSMTMKAYESALAVPVIGPVLAPIAAGVAAAAGLVQLSLIQKASYSGSRELGGSTKPGAMYRVGERGKPEIYEEGGEFYLVTGSRDGRVVPARRDGAGATVVGGGGGDVYVNVYGAPGQPQVRQRQSDRGREIDLVFAAVEDRLVAGVASGTGRLNQQMQKSFRLQRNVR